MNYNRHSRNAHATTLSTRKLTADITNNDNPYKAFASALAQGRKIIDDAKQPPINISNDYMTAANADGNTQFALSVHLSEKYNEDDMDRINNAITNAHRSIGKDTFTMPTAILAPEIDEDTGQWAVHMRISTSLGEYTGRNFVQNEIESAFKSEGLHPPIFKQGSLERIRYVEDASHTGSSLTGSSVDLA